MMRMSKSKVNSFSSPSASTGCASSLVHHTWTVHAVSPLTYYSLRPTYLESMIDEDLCYGGDSCHLTWFTLDGEDDEGRGSLKNDGEDEFYDERSNHSWGNNAKRMVPATRFGGASGGSQYRALRTDHEILFGPYANLNLLIDLYSNDERLLCSVGFCFVELSRGRIGSLGNMALVRGSKPAVEAVWQWMELKTGCRISRNPIRPTSSLIAASVALWTVQSTATPPPAGAKAPRNIKASNKGLVSLCASAPENGSSTESMSSAVRPLVLTWIPPPDCQGRGIDTCSTVVAPAGLLRLCHDLRALQIWKDGLSLFVGDGAKMAAAAKGSQRLPQSLAAPWSNKPDPRQQTSHVADPLLATIVNFVSSELGLQLHRFSLSHATCSVACLGSDGQCKPLSDAYMLQCLKVLRSVVHTLHPTPNDAFHNENISAKQHLLSSAADPPSTKKRAQQDPLPAHRGPPEQHARYPDRNTFGHNGSDSD